MSEQAGLKVGIAFEAVLRCHQDVGRLIADLDSYMARSQWTRLGKQDTVTWDVSRAAYSPYWMAKQLYRLYQDPSSTPGVVEGINIRFFSDDGSLKQPRLVVGRAKYSVQPTTWQSWDFDENYDKLQNVQAQKTGRILSCSDRDKGVEKMLVVGLNLYSITRLDDVTDRLQEIRDNFETFTDE